jgi:cytochrome c oxidase subunit 2
MRLRKARVRSLVRALPALAGLLAVSCAQNYPQNTLAPLGREARTENGLFWFVFWIAAVIFVLVEGAIVVALIRYRSRGGREVPRQVHGNTALELIWTLLPALLLVAVAVPTVRAIFHLAHEPRNSIQVQVIGHQWWWEYRYTKLGVVTANELNVPTGRPIHLTLESADVIHSFWPARVAGKQDVIPGRKNPLTFHIDEPGTYFGQCAEFCGLSHANMRLRVIAQTPSDFDTWVAQQGRPAGQPSRADAARGAELFTSKPCAGCHTIQGTPAQGQVGPNLTHVASRQSFAGSMFELNDENLRAWLHDPPGVKPGSKMPNLQLSDDEVNNLVAYLQTLR